MAQAQKYECSTLICIPIKISKNKVFIVQLFLSYNVFLLQNEYLTLIF
jgi:hypothetical protein